MPDYSCDKKKGTHRSGDGGGVPLGDLGAEFRRGWSWRIRGKVIDGITLACTGMCMSGISGGVNDL